MLQRKFCVAPMMDWTDRHDRVFLRLFSKQALLYTEMITSSALEFGDAQYLLKYNHEEHPVALQIGGSNPKELARGAKLGESAGFDEINLNVGCPSNRVQSGSFGACLMANPKLVADCVKSMKDAVEIPGEPPFDFLLNLVIVAYIFRFCFRYFLRIFFSNFYLLAF